LDLLPLGFIFLVVVVSGGIAYAADKLGKKLGKKRLSLFGLRPKHTAALGTVFLGMAVSLLTIALVASLSKGVRDWITKGSHALVELKKVQTDLDSAHALERQTQSERVRDLREISDLETKIKTGAETLVRIGAQVKNQRTQISALTQRIGPLQAKLASLTLAFKVKDAQFHSSKEKLAESKERLAESERRLASNRKELAHNLAAFNVRYQDSLKVSQKLDADIFAQTKQINDQKGELVAMGQDLAKGKAELEAIMGKLGSEKVDYARLHDQYVELQANTQELSNLLSSSFGPSRYLPLIYTVRQEVCRLELPGRMPLEDAERAVDRLIQMAQTDAVSKGAQAHGNYKVASIYDRPDGTTADRLKTLTIQRLTRQPRDLVLVAYATMNTFKGEPLPLDLGVFPNPLVYRRGQIAKDASIDGHQPRPEIFQQLSVFADTLESKAIFDGMLPKSNNPEAFGSLAADKVLELVDDIKQRDRPVKLEAVAKADIRAADPLDVDFRLR